MSLHHKFLRDLTQVASVRLVASLKDSRIGFPGARDLRIFIPDTHLVSNRVADRYPPTNHTDLLLEIVRKVRDLRQNAADNETIALYHLGDFLDLWRETPFVQANKDCATQIEDDHMALVGTLLDPAVKCRFLLGNHDINLYRLPNYRAWERRYYLQSQQRQKATILVMHGDYFDWVEKIPQVFKRFAVYYVGPLLAPNDFQIEELSAEVDKQNKERDFANGIPPSPPMQPLIDASGTVPDRHNVADNGKFLDSAKELSTEASSSNAGFDIRAVVIGHTHNPRILVDESDGGFFALMDCGSWVGKSSVDGRNVLNAQIGVLCHNEMRVYQVAPKT